MADAVSSLQVVVEGKDETTKVLKGIESSIIRFVGAVSASLAAVSVAVYPVKAAATFQREMLNVGKTTNFTDIQLTTLGDGLKTLSYQLNISADDLAKIAAAGGQMGLGREGVSGLLTFTEAASRMASVLDISAEESGNAIARLTNIFKIGLSESERISSVLNEISNNSTAKGADLIDMIQRIGTAGGTLTFTQSAALAATGRDLGLTVETVGTSFNKVFLSMQTKAAAIAPVLGMSVEKFVAMVKTDGIAALKLYINAINQMGDAQQAAFVQSTVGGGRIFALMTSLAKDGASGYEVLNRNLGSSSKGFTTGTSAIKEQERVMSGLSAQGVALQNVFIGIAESVGRRALPYLTQLTKQLQAWAKDPQVLQFFDGMATYIGNFADAVIGAIKTISGLSEVLGPVLRVFQIFLGIKILGGILGITTSLLAQGKAVTSTTKAWWGLITANQATVRATADAAKALQDGNVTAVAGGKTPKSVSAYGRIGSFLDTALAPKFSLENQLAAKMVEINTADKLLTERTQQRLNVLSSVRKEMADITANYKAQAKAAYDAVIADGGTKKAATAASNASKQASNLRRQRLFVAESDLSFGTGSLSKAYDDALKRRQDKLAELSRQAKATNTSLQNMGTIGPVFAAMGAGIQKAASGVGALAMRFVAIGGTIAAVIGLATYFLDMFGFLDPVVSKLKSIAGITDKVKLEQQRAAAERAASIATERADAEELAKIYDDQKKAQLEAAKAGKTQAVKEPTDLSAEVKQLQVINSKYTALSFQAADIAESTALISSRWGAVNKELEDAKKKYDSLVAKKNLKTIQDATASPFRKDSIDRENIVADKEIAAAKSRIDDLTESIDLLGRARERFEKDAVQNSADSLAVTAEAMKQAERIAPLFDAGGLSALKAFSKVLEGQKKLAAAQKTMEEAGKVVGPEATEAEKTAYAIAEQRVRGLEIELKVLQSSYDDVRTSSANASEFMATAFPDAAKTTVEKVQALIRILGGLNDGTNSAIEEKKKTIELELADIEKAQADIEKRRARKLLSANPDSFSRLYNSITGSADDEIAQINKEAVEANTQLDIRRQKLAAIQNQMKLEVAEATKLQALYKNTTPRDAGQSKVAYFAQTAALKQLNTLQIAAQNKVEEGAKFNAEQIKKLYDESKTALSSTVADAKKELQDLGNYFASRKSTLKLATFDYNQNQATEQYKKFQDSAIEDQRKFLELQGLSSEEIATQIGLLQESNNQMNKMMQAAQDEARQRMIINDIQASMQNEQANIQDAAGKAKAYTDLAKSMREAGNEKGADDYTQKAAVEAEKAKLAVETLTEKLKEYKSEAAKPVVGAAGPMFLVSDSEVSATVEAALKAKVEARQADAAAMEQANTVAAKGAADQEAATKRLIDQAAVYQQQLNDILTKVPGLATAQDALADKVINSTAGLKDVADSLKSIAITDFRGLDQFQTISSQSDKIKSMSADMKAVAQTYAESVVPIGETYANVAKAVTDSLGTAGTKLQESLAAGKVDATVAFPSAVDTLQKEINAGQITVPVQFTGGAGGAIQKNAEGGPIRGPGTGTSDSILSWVSNGEYINDAQTTSFFGENFFQTLKSIARGGKVALSNFSTKVNGGLSLPAFAGGGYVGTSLVGSGSGIQSLMPQSNDAVLGRYVVDLNVGGEKVSMLGERTEVDRLVKALHKMNRG